jgi:hypothetical protein
MDCHCARGWQCEEHQDQPEHHDGCPWPGEQCSNPDCPYWQGEHPKALGSSYFDIVIASTRDSNEDH